jgi:hypothetical protein
VKPTKKDPFIYQDGKQCEYCAKPPVAIALVLDDKLSKRQVYLCDYHRFHLPVATTMLNEYKIGRPNG